MNDRYLRARVLCAVVIRSDGRYLVVRERHPSGRQGSWRFPASAVLPGEGVSQAAVRIAAEKTGRNVRLTGVVSVYSQTVGGAQRIQFNFLAEAASGSAAHRDGSPAWTRWLDRAAVGRLAAEGHVSGPASRRLAQEVARDKAYPLALLFERQGEEASGDSAAGQQLCYGVKASGPAPG